MTLNDAVSCVAILTPVFGLTTILVKYMIINPLQTAINSLKEAVQEMKEMLKQVTEEQRDIDKRLVADEASSKSAHHRLDGIETKLN